MLGRARGSNSCLPTRKYTTILNFAATAPIGHQAGGVLVAIFIISQLLYTLTFTVDAYLFFLPVDWVDVEQEIHEPASAWPYIVLFYPVLKELEATMRTTFLSLSRLDYPPERYRVIAIPNAGDVETIASLRRLAEAFSFLEILEVPPTSDPAWDVVWNAWSENPNAYWWHVGKRAGVRELPPKKTRQLIFAFYTFALNRGRDEDFVINYIDADSCPPVDHFKAAVNGLKRYDVLQAQNVAGNLNASMAASWHAFDHMSWDGYKYPHLTAHGNQPFWVLGKGLFFKASDLVALGGFHPWITIEDPEVGLRFWKNGKKLGVIASPLIEEVPDTFWGGVTQRKRWVCGFFQSLTEPLDRLGYTPRERLQAWLIFGPCLSLWVNSIGIPFGIWGLWTFFTRTSILPHWTVWLALLNVTAFVVSLSALYVRTWQRTALVLDRRRDRLWYMLRVNPVSIMIWWILWILPLAIGLRMFLRDDGLVWERTKKIDANNALVRGQLERVTPSPSESKGQER